MKHGTIKMGRSYSVDSVYRALEHHERERHLHHVSPPYPGHPKWRIVVNEFEEPLLLTTREACAFALGLAAGGAK